ncbi:exocyst complex component 3-like protein [Coregonus clupeaformis]|uniref:exocyst complex component 3-like protein n=1 Tax=Coregonus clupeaformis TaxID=59861 RepID=UPI001BDF88AD|nr:exocyst complex component 3-like protein [Coregonus clupeaformis]
MHKALEVELTDWQRDQEPDTDHEGFYRTSLPTIITQMLKKNARVPLIICESFRNQTIQMGLYEMENLLNRFREARVEFGMERRCIVVFAHPAAFAGGVPLADGGGVCEGVDAE